MSNTIYNMEVAVKLNSKGVSAEAKKVSEAVKNIGKSAKSQINTTASQKAMRDLDKSIQATEKEIDQLERKQSQLKKQNVNTQQYKDLQKELTKAEAELTKLQEAQATAPMSSPQLEAIRTKEIEDTAQKVRYLKEQLSGIEHYGVTDQAASSMVNLEDRAQAAKVKLAELQAQKVQVAGTSGTPPLTGWERFKAVVSSASAKVGLLGKNLRTATGGAIRSGLSGLCKKMTEFASKTLKSHNALKKMKRGLMMGTGIKGLARLGLMGASVYAGVRMMKQGFENLAQYSNPVNSSISSVMGALAQLKNALATAFAPILNVIAPILTSFINMLSQAATAIAHFFSALTGKSSVVVAKKQTANYAKGLAGAGKNAGKAAKKQKKLNDNLLAFDKVNKLTKNDNGSGAGGSGGGGGGGASPSDMFETVKVADKFKDLAKMIKKAWAKGDFTAIGRMLGKKLNKALESINWGKIKATSRKIAKSIATFINGFVEAANWDLVGKTLAEGLNTAIAFFETLIGTLNWKGVGSAIARTIQGFFANLDYGSITRTLSNIVKAIFDIFSGLYQGFNWQGLGPAVIKSLIKIIKNIDYKGIVKSFFTLLGSAYGASYGLLWGVIKGLGTYIGKGIGKAVKGIKKYFSKYTKQSGGDIIQGVFKGIIAAVKKIPSWIKKNIFDPFLKGFKKAFGIGSPAKKMESSGKNIILGVLEGVKEGFKKLAEWFTKLPENIQDILSNAGEIVIGLVGKVTGFAKGGLNKIAGTAVDLAGKASKWAKGGLSKVAGTTVNLAGKASKWAKGGLSKVAGSVVSLWGKATKWAKNGLKALNGTTVKLNGQLVTVHAPGSGGRMVKAEGGVYKGGRWKPITAAAGGGSFNQGQMFVARESGPELVGTIGGHTGVMNNNQIVSSVSAGVYKAVVAGMSRAGNTNVNVTLAGDAAGMFRVMRKQAQNYTMSTGQPAFPL